MAAFPDVPHAFLGTPALPMFSRLLNATFGNVVELILSIAALERGLYLVVGASLVGSILSNLLLVLGSCFLFGGLYHKVREEGQGGRDG